MMRGDETPGPDPAVSERIFTCDLPRLHCYLPARALEEL